MGPGALPGTAGPDFAGVFFSRSRTLPELDAFRVARIANVSEVSMKSAAAMVVALDKTVADPLGPKAVCDPIPPKAPAKSAALPLWSSTTTTRKKQTMIWIKVNRIVIRTPLPEPHSHYSPDLYSINEDVTPWRKASCRIIRARLTMPPKPTPLLLSDPVIEAYKKDVDRTLIRENLKLTPQQRIENLMALQRFAEELRESGRRTNQPQ